MLFPPPPPQVFTEAWKIVNLPTVDDNGVARDTSRGAVGAMTQRLVNGRTIDLSLRSGPMHAFQVRRARLPPRNLLPSVR